MNYQRVDLLVKRIDLGERRLLPLAAELRSAQRQVEDQESEIKRMREMLEHQEGILADEVRIASELGGRIISVQVKKGAQVQIGDELATLMHI